jgi:hypothetical protein
MLRTLRTVLPAPSLLLAAALPLAACDDDVAPASDAGGLIDVSLEPVTVEGSLVSSSACDSCGSGCTEENIVYASRTHRAEELIYPDLPPVGGDHDRCWASWGVHEDELSPRNYVHNLEHGGVVVLYDCPEGCPAEGSALESWVEAQEPGTAILSPASGLPAPFALLAWEHRLLLDCVDLDVLNDFRDMRAGRAPESVTSMPPGNCMP